MKIDRKTGEGSHHQLGRLTIDQRLRRLRRVVGLPERAFGCWFDRYSERSLSRRKEVAAGIDPAYAEIEARSPADGSISFEDFKVQTEIEDRLQSAGLLPRRGWPYKLHWWLGRHGPIQQLDQLEVFVQRGRRGWADRDTYDLDRYLSSVIAGSLRHLADISHGWPGESSEWPTFEQWLTQLRDLADTFDRFCQWEDIPADERESTIDVAFATLRKAWWGLWD
jgi:hypothetical protein